MLRCSVNYGRLFYVWDEFTHWGTVVKHMYLFDALGTHHESSLTFRSYMPGTSIFQYFWVRPFSSFVEYPAFIASNMLFFSLVASFITKINYKNLIIVTIFLLVPLTFDYNLYNTLYVDSFLGIFFGAALLFYFYFRYEDSAYGMLMVSAAIAILTLTKEVGLIFSLIFIVIIGFDLLIYKKSKIKENLIRETAILNRVKYIIQLLGPFLVFAFIMISWRLLLVSASVQSGMNTVYLVSLFSLRDNLLPHQAEVIDAFKTALFNRPLLPFGISYLHIIAAVFLGSLLIFYLYKKGFNLKRPTMAIFLSLVGSLVYITARFVFYLFLLGEYEGPRLASFERHILAYLAGIFVALPIYFAEIPEKNFFFKRSDKRKKSRHLWVVSSVAVITIMTLTSIFLLPESFKGRLAKAPGYFVSRLNGVPIESIKERREKFDIILKWSANFHQDNNYYLVAQGYKDYSMWVCNYLLYPHKAFHNSGQVEPYPAGSDASGWGDLILGNYDFIYMLQYDQPFEEAYGHFFDHLHNGQLYEVRINKYGDLNLLALDK